MKIQFVVSFALILAFSPKDLNKEIIKTSLAARENTYIGSIVFYLYPSSSRGLHFVFVAYHPNNNCQSQLVLV